MSKPLATSRFTIAKSAFVAASWMLPFYPLHPVNINAAIATSLRKSIVIILTKFIREKLTLYLAKYKLH
jgi:hypothetical protein